MLASELMLELGLELRNYWAGLSTVSVNLKEGVVLRKNSKNIRFNGKYTLFFSMTGPKMPAY